MVMFKLHAYRAAFIAAVALVVAVTAVPHAQAISPQVRNACANDYLSNCSAYKPESAETRKCMRAVGHRFSEASSTIHRTSSSKGMPA